MDEAEHADRIAIIDGGEIVAVDTPGNLKAAVGLDRVRLRTVDNRMTLRTLQAAGVQAWQEDDTVVLHLPDAERNVSRLLSLIRVPISYLNVQRPTLDDVFLHFTEQSIFGPPESQPATQAERAAPVGR